MGIFELIFIAVGLSMDAFAVSICKGLSMKKMSSAAVKAIAPLNVVRKRERNPSILKGPSTAVRFPAVSVRPAGKHRLLLRISSAVS